MIKRINTILIDFCQAVIPNCHIMHSLETEHIITSFTGFIYFVFNYPAIAVFPKSGQIKYPHYFLKHSVESDEMPCSD